MRGPLDVLREAWEGPETQEVHSILAHVLKMREKMENMTELVQANMEQAQTRQKAWYDKAARQRNLTPAIHVILSRGDPIQWGRNDMQMNWVPMGAS